MNITIIPLGLYDKKFESNSLYTFWWYVRNRFIRFREIDDFCRVSLGLYLMNPPINFNFVWKSSKFNLNPLGLSIN